MTTPTSTFTVDTFDENFGATIDYCKSGDVVGLEAKGAGTAFEYLWNVDGGCILEADLPDFQKTNPRVHWDTTGSSGFRTATVTFIDVKSKAQVETAKVTIHVRPSPASQQLDSLPISMRRASAIPSKDQIFWTAIRNRTKAIRFDGSGFSAFIDKVLGHKDSSDISAQNAVALNRQRGELFSPTQGMVAYDLLKTATQVFLLMEAGVIIKGTGRYDGKPLFDPLQETQRLGRSITLEQARNELPAYLGGGNLPYINRILESVFKNSTGGEVFNGDFLDSRVSHPSMLELIYSYWLEEGMLVQTINAICMRFQNRRAGTGQDPLAHMEIASLYPINNLLWGYIQDEHNRLSLARKSYEYSHQYGLTLYGKAVPEASVADNRSKFLEAFHNLIYTSAIFYRQDDDTTVMADGFPLLNALKEVHLILSQGAHNQFGDLPWTARAEMLMQQYILSRPEMKKFLQSREMVPYRESWMAQVDTMKSIQGWTDVSITHFHTLAEFGEQLLLSIRYGDWVNAEDTNQASNWARYWRAEIQGYIHSYRATTGVDILADHRDSQQIALLATQPGLLLKERLSNGNGHVPALPVIQQSQPAGFRSRHQSAPRQLP